MQVSQIPKLKNLLKMTPFGAMNAQMASAQATTNSTSATYGSNHLGRSLPVCNSGENTE